MKLRYRFMAVWKKPYQMRVETEKGGMFSFFYSNKPIAPSMAGTIIPKIMGGGAIKYTSANHRWINLSGD